MDLPVLYPAQANSPTTVTMGAIGSSNTQITVQNADILPAPPNLLVLGAQFVNAETVLMVEMVGNTITIQRGIEGGAREWPEGTTVSRNFTAKDHNDLIAIVTDTAAQMIVAENAIDALGPQLDATTARHNILEEMTLRNRFSAAIAVEEDPPAVLVDDDGTPIAADWRYKEQATGDDSWRYEEE